MGGNLNYVYGGIYMKPEFTSSQGNGCALDQYYFKVVTIVLVSFTITL